MCRPVVVSPVKARRPDIKRFYADIVAGKTAAGRVGRGGKTTGGTGAGGRTISLLHAIFEHAIRMGITENNSVRGTRRLADQARDRRLSHDEIKRLGQSLHRLTEEGENPTPLAVIELIVLTGFRRSEALLLEYKWVTEDYRAVRFPDTKTGRQTRIIGQASARSSGGNRSSTS